MTCHKYDFCSGQATAYNVIPLTTSTIRFEIIPYQQYHNHVWVSQCPSECECAHAPNVNICYFCNGHVWFADFRQSSLGQFKSNRWIDWNSTWPKFNIMQSLIIVWNCVNLTANIKMKRYKATKRRRRRRRGKAQARAHTRWIWDGCSDMHALARTSTCNSKSTNNTQ